MPSLSKEHRNLLARTVLEARALAERAAAKTLHGLGVAESDPPGHLSEDVRVLRRALRAQAKQSGDTLDGAVKGTNGIRHLCEKVGYDHWHRLLFSRFLAENNLLISPKHGVNVTLSDCEDLAAEMGLKDGWEVASRFAAQMLPQIFRIDDPVGQVEFAPEDKSALRKMVTTLPPELFHADDSLGWVYQYWQAQRKDEVNASEVKIGADELSPVTQLFTEDYMVLFLLHNTLGAWWAGKKLAGALKSRKFESEQELRDALALPGVDWAYLRFVKDDAGWRPAAGVFPGWPAKAMELRFLDPSMGSGHFLVFALPILAAMRQEEERMSVDEACDAVLRNNLFGLELDPRCTQIAAFNLAFASWKLGGYRPLPQLNLACCGLGINAKKEDWLRLADGDVRMRAGMEELYDLFQQAPVLGSLIDPKKIGEKVKGQGELLLPSFHEMLPLLDKALAAEKTKKDEVLSEMGVTAQGLAHAAEILAGGFTLVATNVPYLGRGKQGDQLKEFCEKWHPDAKADLATCFVERCLTLCEKGGSVAVVTPQNWLFLGTYKKLRERLLREVEWRVVGRLGEHGFDSPQAAGAFTAMICLTNSNTREEHAFAGIDVSGEKTPGDKSGELIKKDVVVIGQKGQLGNPDARIKFESFTGGEQLANYAQGLHGQGSFDDPCYVYCFWELATLLKGWIFQQTTGTSNAFSSGLMNVFRWEDGKGMLYQYMKAKADEGYTTGKWRAGISAWGKQGIAIGGMRQFFINSYAGQSFDTNVAVILPEDPSIMPALWCYISSPEFHDEVRALDKNIKVSCNTYVKVPFDLPRWQKTAAEKYPHGLPKPFSSDPTQWLFSGHPVNSDNPLHVATARLLGYLWPRQTGSSFPDCPALPPDNLAKLSDDDGIVCINAIKGEHPAAERLRSLLAAAYGAEWSAGKQADLLSQVDFSGKTIEDWLRNGFFDQHCKLFHQRPFIWQIWDGRKDGFSALVNYHKLDRRTLEKLAYTYLGDWIVRQKAANDADEPGSDDRLLAARTLQDKLKCILDGEKPYDIFIRWKPLKKQSVGWDPDLNDGVRLNIRPFMTAGLLRKDPKIHWNKDRGKDVESAPWFKVFKGERINDHHLTLAEKRKARE